VDQAAVPALDVVGAGLYRRSDHAGGPGRRADTSGAGAGARVVARRRLGHVEAFRGGLLGRSRSWKASTSPLNSHPRVPAPPQVRRAHNRRLTVSSTCRRTYVTRRPGAGAGDAQLTLADCRRLLLRLQRSSWRMQRLRMTPLQQAGDRPDPTSRYGGRRPRPL